jgi:probable HAF family extracellular repeat protein
MAPGQRPAALGGGFFYTVLSLAPLLVIVIRAMGIAHARRFAREQIIRQATNLMGTQAADAVKSIIESSATQGIGLLATAISTVVLLFSATSVFIELQNSMNSIWGDVGAFVDFGGGFVDLNPLIDPLSGWTLEAANGINASGQIVGYGIGPDGDTDAFLLTPVPEPSTGLSIAIGGGLLLRLRPR